MSALPHKHRKFRSLGTLVLLAFILSALYWWGVATFVPEDSRGTFGDMFGGLNALFTALAFAGLLYSTAQQQEEIDLQVQELQETRQEFQQQTRTFQKQSFESTYFQLLSLHYEIVNSQRATYGSGVFYEHRQAFFIAAGELAGRLLNERVHQVPKEKQRELLHRHFPVVCLSPQADFGHYFRNLYHIVKFIDQSPVENKSLYTSILRAQLSNDEQRLLFFNCLEPAGVKFKPLVERYALLEQMRDSEVTPVFREAYKPEAFGEA